MPAVKTASVNVRIDNNVKAHAEDILTKMGISTKSREDSPSSTSQT